MVVGHRAVSHPDLPQGQGGTCTAGLGGGFCGHSMRVGMARTSQLLEWNCRS